LEDDGSASDRAERLASLRSIATRPEVWTGQLILIAAAPLGAFTFVGLGSYAGERHVGLWLATMALTAAATANGAARLAVGTASDRWGVGRALLLILAADLVAAAILWAAPGAAGLLFLAATCAGLAMGGAAGVVSRLAADAAPDAPNSAFGLLFAAYAVGVSIGPLLGSAAGSGQTAWLVVGGLALPGLVLLSLRSRLHHPQAVRR
jgi:MFS family permease